MDFYEPRITYKLRCAVALAGTLGMLRERVRFKDLTSADGLYDKLLMEGYCWEAWRQQWAKKVYFQNDEFVVREDVGVEQVGKNHCGITIDIRMEGDWKTNAQHIDRFPSFLKLADMILVGRRSETSGSGIQFYYRKVFRVQMLPEHAVNWIEG